MTIPMVDPNSTPTSDHLDILQRLGLVVQLRAQRVGDRLEKNTITRG
jgi:hypothetical protein